MNYAAIAIDGPSGAGKSTMAKRLAQELGFLYLDTGAIYRTVGLHALREGVDPGAKEAVLALLPSLTVTTGYGEDGLQHMYRNGEDVTQAIREHQVSDAASKVSAIPGVRAYLLDMQRQTAREHNVVMDGRDIGTVVLPDAKVKIFLTAQPEARARRRYDELIERGQRAVYEQILQDVIDRDYRDTHRDVAPLKQAEDAVLVDTTELSLEESWQKLYEVVKERLAQ